MRLDDIGKLLGRHPALLAVAVLQRGDGGRQRNGAVGILADESGEVLERLGERCEHVVGGARSRAPAPAALLALRPGIAQRVARAVELEERLDGLCGLRVRRERRQREAENGEDDAVHDQFPFGSEAGCTRAVKNVFMIQVAMLQPTPMVTTAAACWSASMPILPPLTRVRIIAKAATACVQLIFDAQAETTGTVAVVTGGSCDIGFS